MAEENKTTFMGQPDLPLGLPQGDLQFGRDAETEKHSRTRLRTARAA